jgi:hypothetical protein
MIFFANKLGNFWIFFSLLTKISFLGGGGGGTRRIFQNHKIERINKLWMEPLIEI